MKPFIINRTHLRPKTRCSCVQSQNNSVIHEFILIFMALCLIRVGMNDMRVIDLENEMHLTLADSLRVVSGQGIFWLFPKFMYLGYSFLFCAYHHYIPNGLMLCCDVIGDCSIHPSERGQQHKNDNVI